MHKPIKVPKHFERVTNPDLCVQAMISAKASVSVSLRRNMRMLESGELSLFRVQQNVITPVQRSLAGYVDGRRYVVVWRPLELTRAPEVFLDTRSFRVEEELKNED